jgi:hypothetical protein
MVGHIKSGPVFVGLGIGLEVLTVAALFTLFKKTRLALKTQARLETLNGAVRAENLPVSNPREESRL